MKKATPKPISRKQRVAHRNEKKLNILAATGLLELSSTNTASTAAAAPADSFGDSAAVEINLAAVDTESAVVETGVDSQTGITDPLMDSRSAELNRLTQENI